MKVLLIGSGGREHALAWKLSQSPRVTELFCAPGNPGIGEIATNVPIAWDNKRDLHKFIRTNDIGLVVIGPEDPLAAGLADELSELGVKVFGPNRRAAALEGDKWFAKELMRQQSVPTAEARSFTDPAAAEDYIRTRDQACVVKAAGLAKGKGVTVCQNADEAVEAVNRIMRDRAFGEAGARVVIEEKLKGPECSILAFVDRRSIYVMEPSQDHKPVGDGDTGPMTGGMGAYTPTPVITEAVLQEVEKQILVPVADGLLRDKIEFKGILYAGLMLTEHGPKVLEFNCRFGDPETQPLMMRLKTDLAEVMLAVIDGTLDDIHLEWDPRPAISVIACSGGYPGDYAKGVPIHGIAEAEAIGDVKVFHSGTKLDKKDQLVTDGGRVLAVTALGNDIADARQRAYEAISKIRFEGMHYRTDIAHQAIRK